MPKRDHPLARFRRPDVFAPGEELPEPGRKEPIFGPGLPFFIGLVIGIVIVAAYGEGSFWVKLIGPVIGGLIGEIFAAFYDRS